MMKRYEKPTLKVAEIELASIILTSEEEPVEETPDLPVAVFDLGSFDWQSMWSEFSLY